MQPSQFRILYRVFLMRVVDLELLSKDGDPARLLGQLAALLAGISLTFSLPLLLIGRVTPEMAAVAEHSLIALNMVVIGLLSVLSWDAIFPDRRDAMVLSPLPVAPRTIFLAKAAALTYAICLSFIALNIFTGLFWASCFSTSDSLLGAVRAIAVYWVSNALAAAFVFTAVIAFQGAISQLLPRQIFLRLSAPLQMGAFCLILGIYILEPSLESTALLSAPVNQSLLAFLPSYWFYALFQQLNGAPSPVYAPLAARAGAALAIALGTAAVTLAISFLRSLRKIAEQPEVLPLNWPAKRSFPASHSLPGAVALFCLRTLLRSAQHRLVVSSYLGGGMAIVLVYVRAIFFQQHVGRAAAWSRPGTALIIPSLLMLSVAIAALRVVAALPVALRANWIFRVTEVHPPEAYLVAVRRAFLLLGALPVYVVSAVVFLALWPARFALEHLVVLALLGCLLTEFCLPGFHKLPFTCSYLPGSGNLQYVFWVVVLLVLPFIGTVARFELRMLSNPAGFAAIVAALSILLVLARKRTAVVLRPVSRMLFDEVEPHQILSLNLNQP